MGALVACEPAVTSLCSASRLPWDALSVMVPMHKNYHIHLSLAAQPMPGTRTDEE